MLPSLGRGFLAAIPVGGAMLLDLELDSPVAGAVSTGAMLAGFVAFDAPPRTRLVWQLVSAPAIGACAAVGALSGDSGVAAALTMTAVASLAGMSVAVSPRLAVAGMTCVLALLLGQGLSLSASQAPEALGLGAAGVGLQAVMSMAAWASDHTSEPIALGDGVRHMGPALRASLDWRSPSLRHAVRWGSALGVGVAVYHLVDLGPHGYWVPLTVLFVLRSEPDETAERIWMRAAGTLAGLALATPLAELIGRHAALDAIALTIAAAFSFALLAIEYALFTTAITAFIVLSAHALGQGAVDAAGERALATLIGLGIVAVALALWGSPTRSA